MSKRFGNNSLVLLLGLLVFAGAAAAAPFGGAEDEAFAGKLWKTLEEARLVGDKTIHSTPYEGSEPHGFILETLDDFVEVEGRSGLVVVKKNYGPAKVSRLAVADNPGKYLKAITVMFRREKGYDPDNQDWFWVKYGADGSLLKNPKGMKLAGRVAKGSDKGCIACHQVAPGNDYIFNNDRFAK